MWEVPRYRIRAYLRAQRKANGQPYRRKKKTIHVRRTRAELRVVEGFASPSIPIQARVILNDISPVGIRLYSASPFREGQMIALTIQEPHMFYAKGRVVTCEHISPSVRVLTNETYPYKIEIKFEFHSLFERNAVRAYCNEVLGRYLYGTA